MSDYMKLIIVIAGLILVSLMRYYFSTSKVEPKIEMMIEEIVEIETGINILPIPQ